MKKRFSFVTNLLHSILIVIIIFGLFSSNVEVIYADTNLKAECSKDAVLQLAKIIFNEAGHDSAKDPTLNFYRRMTVASIVLNNAYEYGTGSTWYEKLYTINNHRTVYGGYYNYIDKDFESFLNEKRATTNQKGEMLYIAQLVLTGKYNLPKNMNLQASQEIVLNNGTKWDSTESIGNSYDIYIGYEESPLSDEDIFGNKLKDTTPEYFRKLAESLKLDDYTKYTVDNICKNSLGSGVVEAKKNKATFYIETGSDVIYESTTFSQGSTITMPTPPTKEGYKFTGWVLEDGKKFNSISRVSEDIKLYASWKKKQTTVNVFNAKCGGADILKVIKFIWTLLSIVLFVVPMGLIVMISLDLVKNVIAGKEDDMKKNFNIAIKRIIFCLFLFLVEPICTFAIDMLGNNANVNWAECIEIAIDPNTNFDDYKVDLDE